MSRLQTPTARQRAANTLVLLHALAAFAALQLLLFGRWTDTRQGHSWVQLLLTAINIPVGPNLASVVILTLLTMGLSQRKRVAYVVVIVFQCAGMYVSAGRLAHATTIPAQFQLWQNPGQPAFHLTSIVLGIGMIVCLGWLAPEFSARLLKGSWWQAGLVLVAGSVLTVVTAIVVLMWRRPDLGWPNARRVSGLIVRALGGDARQTSRLDVVLAWQSQLVAVVFGITIIAAVLVFARSARRSLSWTGDHEMAIRELVHDYGNQDSLAYFATRRDKQAIFSPDGKAVVTYRVLAGVSLASADPVGDQHSWPKAIQAWLKEARTYGWIPAVICCSEEGARAYAEYGLNVISLGDEVILHPDRFNLDSTEMARARQAVARARRAGLTVKIRRQTDLSPEEVWQFKQLASEWLRGAEERGFSTALNRDGDPADMLTLYVTAHDADDAPVGMLTFVPWGQGGVSLDVMRRREDAPAGVTELMVCELLARAREVGVRRISLNFVVFKRTFEEAEKVGAPMTIRVSNSVLGFLSRWWQLGKLYVSSRQYQPTWQSRFFCYDSVVTLPQAAIAAGIAEGYVPGPAEKAPSRALTAEQLTQVQALNCRPSAEALAALPRESRLTQGRIEVAQAAKADGVDPWPVVDLVPDSDLDHLASYPWDDTRKVCVAGRVRRVRDHGGVIFIDITDAGAIVQAIAERSRLGAETFSQLRRQFSRGDVIVTRGQCGASRTGTNSILIDEWRLQAKCLRPIPFESFTDPEARLRQRSLDMIVHPEQIDTLRSRSQVASALRATLDQAGFLEVETPVLQAIHGGATARPFQTWINAYSTELFMRIAPELYLKRLLVGGMGAIYEMSRNFRNEGADATHNPEFTSLEAYKPYSDYNDMRLLTQDMVRAAAMAVHARPEIQLKDGRWFDLSGDWPVVPIIDAVSEALHREVSLDMDFDELMAIAREHGVRLHDGMGAGAIIEELYGELVEHHQLEPTFFTDYPVETSPLTRPHRSKPGLVEKWDLVVNGMELATAFTELTDPIDQRQRLTDQSLKAAAGDAEAMALDEDFLAALELGMPPTGGMGIGVDRLAMLLTGQVIRGVLTFPFMKPLKQGKPR